MLLSKLANLFKRPWTVQYMPLEDAEEGTLISRANYKSRVLTINTNAPKDAQQSALERVAAA